MSNTISKKQRQHIMELCGVAAKELREAVEGFRLDFDENGMEHVSAAMEYIDELQQLIAATPAP